VSRHTDQVFPVSLSEIAFTLVLVLMLLLGYMFLQEREARDAAEQKLRDAVVTQNGEATLKMLESAKRALEVELRRAGAKNPDLLIATISNAGEKTAEATRLQQEVADLTKKLVALEELRSRVESAGRSTDDQLTREQVERAIVLQKEVERILAERAQAGHASANSTSASPDTGTRIVVQALATTSELHKQAREKLQQSIVPGEEPKTVRELVAVASEASRERGSGASVGSLRAENEKLQTQLQFYAKRDKLRGLDHPPCWMDSESRIEYIYNVQTTPEGFFVSRGWPSHRESDARASDGFSVLMAQPGVALSSEQFGTGAKPYLDYGKKQSPECRHFVYLSSTIPNADRRDDARRLVSSFFYILERKAPVTP